MEKLFIVNDFAFPMMASIVCGSHMPTLVLVHYSSNFPEGIFLTFNSLQTTFEIILAKGEIAHDERKTNKIWKM